MNFRDFYDDALENSEEKNEEKVKYLGESLEDKYNTDFELVYEIINFLFVSVLSIIRLKNNHFRVFLTFCLVLLMGYYMVR